MQIRTACYILFERVLFMQQKKFVIITENTCDLPQSYLAEHGIVCLPLTFTLGDQEYDGTPSNSPDPHEFYDALRAKTPAKTSQVTSETFKACYRDVLNEADGFLHIAFSSGLSGSYQSAKIAFAEVKQEFPDADIYCIDSLCASLGQGLLVDYAVRRRDEGILIDKVASEVERMKLQLCHYFTVDDLNHLYRGGRVSKTAALFGSMLGIKPVMHVDDEGKLIPIGKIRGRKGSLDEIVKKMGDKLSIYSNPYIFICHADCIDEAKYVAEQVKKAHGIKTLIINDIGPVIGSHAGPGTIALFFFGSDRAEKRM